ncbi:MAG TPA: hypothetical protein VEI02_07795, partial [Planctomycetota bacterium]|nr:hypothetical protein [Planctomycetota bacterium]
LEFGPGAWRRPGALLGRATLVALPTLAWFAVGWAASGRADWYFAKDQYREIVDLRGGPWSWVLLSNAVTRLPRVLPPPALWLVALGASAPPRRGASGALALAAIPAAVAYAVVSALYTSPEPTNRFFVGLNPKVTAAAVPLFALLAARGLDAFVRDPRGPAGRRATWIVGALFLLGAPIHVLDDMGPNRTPAEAWDAAAGPNDLGALAAAVVDHVRSRPWPTARYLLIAAGTVALGLLLTRTRLGPLAARGVAAVASPPNRAAPLRALVAAAFAVGVVFASTQGPWSVARPRAPAELRYRQLDAFVDWYLASCPDRPDVLHTLVPSLRHFAPGGTIAAARKGAPSPRVDYSWTRRLDAALESGASGQLFLLGFRPIPPGVEPPSPPWSDRDRFEPVDAVLEVDGARYAPILFRRKARRIASGGRRKSAIVPPP